MTMLGRSWSPESETEVSKTGAPLPAALKEILNAGDDTIAVAALAATSDLRKEHRLEHYLYFPNKSSAQKCASDLIREGFSVTVDRSAMGKDWLVLARHSIAPHGETMTALRERLTTLAEKYQGEYDGWEAETVKETS